MSMVLKVLYLIHYDSLLKNATYIITKCESYFITKCDRNLLQNALGFLLQNATVLLQSATVITKCNVYYKLRHILQFPPLLQSYRVSSIITSIQNIYQLTDFKTCRVFRGYRKIPVE